MITIGYDDNGERVLYVDKSNLTDSELLEELAALENELGETVVDSSKTSNNT